MEKENKLLARYPRPWRFQRPVGEVWDAEARTVCLMVDTDGEAAEHIVRCVNLADEDEQTAHENAVAREALLDGVTRLVRQAENNSDAPSAALWLLQRLKEILL